MTLSIENPAPALTEVRDRSYTSEQARYLGAMQTLSTTLLDPAFGEQQRNVLETEDGIAVSQYVGDFVVVSLSRFVPVKTQRTVHMKNRGSVVYTDIMPGQTEALWTPAPLIEVIADGVPEFHKWVKATVKEMQTIAYHKTGRSSV